MRQPGGRNASGDLSESSFRALQPDKLNASILALCRQIVAEEERKQERSESREAVHD